MIRLADLSSDILRVAGTIAAKDIIDAVRNKAVRINIVVILVVILFQNWYSYRLWDRKIDVVFLNEGYSNISTGIIELAGGYSVAFEEVSTTQEMRDMMGWRELGLVVPANFEEMLDAGDEPTLTGYILWAYRNKAADFETKYSKVFTELLGSTIHVKISKEYVIPDSDIQVSSVHFNIFFAIFWMAVAIVPHLMLEEKTTRTMDALLTSPVTSGQVIAGKAMAGAFYVILAGSFSIALNASFVTNWSLALLGLVCAASFSLAFGLALGSFYSEARQLKAVTWIIMFFLLAPASIAMDQSISEGLRIALAWLPTAALGRLFHFSFSTGPSLAQLTFNLVIVLGYTALLYAFVIARIGMSDRHY